MFLARTLLAGQTVSFSWLFGTPNTPFRIFIINSRRNQGLTKISTGPAVNKYQGEEISR